MAFHGPLRDVEALRDLLVVQAVPHEPENVELASGDPCVAQRSAENPAPRRHVLRIAHLPHPVHVS